MIYDSIVDAIGRTPWEAVVVDNASTDGTVDAARAVHRERPRMHDRN